jgi:hypothetical protein
MDKGRSGQAGEVRTVHYSTCIAFLQGSLLDSKRSIVHESIVVGIAKDPTSCICSPLQAVQPQRGMGIFNTGVPQLYLSSRESSLGACLSSTVALITYPSCARIKPREAGRPSLLAPAF